MPGLQIDQTAGRGVELRWAWFARPRLGRRRIHRLGAEPRGSPASAQL